MRITFITSGFGLSGGTKAIFELANNLTKGGHEVFVICSLTPFVFADRWFNPFNILTKILRIFKKSKGCRTPVEWFGVRAKLLCVPSFDEKYIPDADIILATWWETAYFVKNYSGSKGKKFYFIQDYEVWLGNEEKVKATYNFGFKIIVNSTWLKNKLRKEAGVDADTIILHAPDHQQFFPEKAEKEKNKIRILMPYRDERWKGAKEGIETFKIIKREYPNVKLVMFGKKIDNLNFGGLENEVEYHLSPVKGDLRRLYNSCDIFCFSSLEEGFGMPPMEAMACGIPVVATNVGAIPEYAIHGETALLSAPGDVEAMAKNIIKLIENKKERERIAAKALKRIRNFTWEGATGELEKVFKKYV